MLNRNVNTVADPGFLQGGAAAGAFGVPQGRLRHINDGANAP